MSGAFRRDIDTTNARYVERVDKMEKRGSKADNTHAAHLMSWELVNYVFTNTNSGRPLGNNGRDKFATAMGGGFNLRIKSADGNTKLDARRDARIGRAITGDGELYEATTAARAVQVYKAGMHDDAHAAMRGVAQRVGDLTVHTGKPGRPVMVKNLAKT
jgi:hypothetical protein